MSRRRIATTGVTVALAMVLALVLLTTILGAASRADPLPNGTTRVPAAMISDAAPLRQALIVAPGVDSAGPADPRRMLLAADARAYRDLLRLLGFDVTLVVAEGRPDLDAAMRGFAASVRRGADVSVFMLGTVIPFENTLYLPPSGTPLPAGSDAGMLATEGLRVGDVLRRIMDQAPKDIALVLDQCVPADANANCPTGTIAFPEGVSGILAQPTGGTPATAAGSIRVDLLPLMQQEGLPLPELFSMLADKLRGRGVTLLGTSSLSRRFSFLPVGFLQRLPLACNSVDPRLGADGLRVRPSLDPVVADCAVAASLYRFSPLFRNNLAVVREQRAAQLALADCTDAAGGYLAHYPRGTYRSAVLEQQTKCRPAPPPPTPPPMPTAPPAPSAQATRANRALAAVIDYYRRHDYEQGAPLDAIAGLYPSQFQRGSVVVSKSDHLRSLGDWYSAYTAITFHVVPDSIDLSGCNSNEACLVRGRVTSHVLGRGRSDALDHAATFSLRFDLGEGVVRYECAMSDPPKPKEPSCE